MVSEQEIREKLSAVQNNELQVEDFADWIEGAGRDLKRNTPVVVSLINSVRHLLAEYDQGFLSESALLEKLEEISEGAVISVSLVVDRQGYFAPTRRLCDSLMTSDRAQGSLVSYSA